MIFIKIKYLIYISRNFINYRKLYHLKAIEIGCKTIKEDCPLITHLINTFFKYHKFQLDNIAEESFLNFTNEQNTQKTESS